MFDHVKFGVSNYEVSKAFFLKALEPLGVAVVSEGAAAYGVELSPEGKASLCLFQTEETPAHLHLAFVAENRQQVEAFYRAALEAGGKNNGAPGLRPHYHANYYAAFVIGPDGHNIEVVCHESEAKPFVILRNPIPGDIGWLISMHGKVYAEQFKFDSNFEIDIAKKAISFFELKNEFNMLWVATISNQPVGSIAVSLKPDQTAFINFLLVLTEYRGCGVAKILMNKVVSHCRNRNVDLLRLETYSCLKSARELYKKYGFVLLSKNVDVEKYGQSFDQEFWEKRL